MAKTTITLQITPHVGKSYKEALTFEKEKFLAIRELNEEKLPFLKQKHKQVLVIKVK